MHELYNIYYVVYVCILLHESLILSHLWSAIWSAMNRLASYYRPNTVPSTELSYHRKIYSTRSTSIGPMPYSKTHGYMAKREQPIHTYNCNTITGTSPCVYSDLSMYTNHRWWVLSVCTPQRQLLCFCRKAINGPCMRMLCLTVTACRSSLTGGQRAG